MLNNIMDETPTLNNIMDETPPFWYNPFVNVFLK